MVVLSLALSAIVAACGGGSATSASATRSLGSTRATVRTADAALIALLKKNGAHLARSRSTRLYLDFGSKANETAAAAEIAAPYTVEVADAADSNGQWVVRVTTTMVVTLDAIGGQEAALTRIARRHHGALDGWEAAPTP